MAPFFFRKRTKSHMHDIPAPPPQHQPAPRDPHFAHSYAVHDTKYPRQTPASSSLHEDGPQVLLKFITQRLGKKAQRFAFSLMNRNPLQEEATFSYQVHQSTEATDLQIIHRDLTSGRLYRVGLKYVASPWASLLFGDKFLPTINKRQVHELTYTRSTCACLVCLIRENIEAERNTEQQERDDISNSSANSYTPKNSAMANFVRPYVLPPAKHLARIGAESTWKELEIGSVVRLNSRAGAKLKFTEDMKTLFSHVSYTGPMTHELMYRKVTTIGVNYYQFNKGKKERKVYLQGNLYQLPLEMGVVKLGTRPLRTDEVGAYHILYRRQVMEIYVGELVLEGNSIGSFIPTGIKFFVGVGEEDGCAPVYQDYRLGTRRRLGVNELLLHHHMVDDLKVRIF